MKHRQLNTNLINNAKPGTYEDGAGLRLVVNKNGSKNWIFRYTFNHRRRDMGLGGYPHVLSLSEARRKAKNADK